jgi:hypothetical protein
MGNTTITIPELGDKFNDYRDEIWGNSYTWSWERPITQVKYAVIHHTVTSRNATADDIAALHKARGWDGIGYHFVIPGNGIVHYVGDLSTARANVANMNEQVLGIALCGDFTQELPTDAQIDSAHKLVKWLINTASIPNINGWEDMVGHQDLGATACPGSVWKGPPDSMYERIKNNIPYNPPPTTPPPDEKYHVVYKGETIATYDYNPTDKINELTQKLSDCQQKVSDQAAEISQLTLALQTQENDNANLQGQLRDCQRQKDEALALAKSLERELADSKSKLNTCLTDLDNCKNADDTMCKYSRSQLLKWGLFGKPDICKG